MLPPSLAWIPDVTDSLGRASGTPASFETRKGVNQLVYTVRIHFTHALPSKSRMLVWNIIGMYAAKNDCVMVGSPTFSALDVRFDVGMKRRLGLERKSAP